MNTTYFFLLLSITVSLTVQAAPQLIYVPLAKSCRVVDTRDFSSPLTDHQPTQSFQAWDSQVELNVQDNMDGLGGRSDCQPASGMTPAAAVANVTAVARRYHSRGNITVYPTGNSLPDSSLINFQANNVANASIIGIGRDGYFDVTARFFGSKADNQRKTDVIVDINGYFYPKSEFNETTAASGLSYVPLPAPCRIVDTRRAGLTYETAIWKGNRADITQSFRAWGSKVNLDAQRDIEGHNQLPACQSEMRATPAAMVANVTVIAKKSQSRGNLVAYPSGSIKPEVSLINFRGNNIANSSILTLNPENAEHFNITVRMFADGSGNKPKTDVVVDVMGYFYPQTSFDGQVLRPDMTYRPLSESCRLVDTRSYFQAFDQSYYRQFLAWGTTTELNNQRGPTFRSPCLPEPELIPEAWVGNVTVAAKRFHARGNFVAYAPQVSDVGYLPDTVPSESSLVNFDRNNIANASIFPLRSARIGLFNIQANLFGNEVGNQRKADVIVDATGYFYPQTSGTTTRVSVASDGTQSDGGSFNPSISAEGRYIAFQSSAANLVEGDDNGVDDIFVHDRQTQTTQRASINSDGVQGNGDSSRPSMSADGRFIAFRSFATNLVSADSNDTDDIFVHDRQTGMTRRVSLASDGTQSNRSSSQPAISADGRFISFTSDANNLVEGDNNDDWAVLFRIGTSDIFVHDRETGVTQRVSISSDGMEGHGDSSAPSISADGRFIAFGSRAPNLVEKDLNSRADIFVHDRLSGVTQRVSVSSRGVEGYDSGSYYSDISADGRFITFVSGANNLVARDGNGVPDIFVHDQQNGITQRIAAPVMSRPGAALPSTAPRLSGDGRFIVFRAFTETEDRHLTWHIFMHDRQTNITRRILVIEHATQGGPLTQYTPRISTNGHLLVFRSYENNLIAGDSNGVDDIFVRTLTSP